MLLSQIKIGQKAIVVGFDKDPDFDLNHVLNHGIYEGAEILLCHVSPLGKDPIALEVNGSKLAIRKSLAEKIKIKLVVK